MAGIGGWPASGSAFLGAIPPARRALAASAAAVRAGLFSMSTDDLLLQADSAHGPPAARLHSNARAWHGLRSCPSNPPRLLLRSQRRTKSLHDQPGKWRGGCQWHMATDLRLKRWMSACAVGMGGCCFCKTPPSTCRCAARDTLSAAAAAAATAGRRSLQPCNRRRLTT